MTNQEYNGWTNWETWNFKLWIDSDESAYNAVIELAEDMIEGENASLDFSKELEAWTDDMRDAVEIESGFFADVCNSAIRKVNFYEIAEAYLEEL
jgi:hypothetical protein